MLTSSSLATLRPVAFPRFTSMLIPTLIPTLIRSLARSLARSLSTPRSLLRPLAAVTMMAFASVACATVVTVSIQGNVGQDGIDQSSGVNGVFGPVGSLAGAPFTLTTTIDDTGGVPVVPDSANTSSISTHIATSVLTVNGMSVNMGSLPSNTGSVVKSLSPALFDFLLSGSDAANVGSALSARV